jgi:predicted amidophosphoribosyltransferase
VEIGRAVGAKLGLPVVHLFKSVPLKGTSHPKKNARRPPLTLLEAPRRPTLVIDDVATSGAHLEQAVKLLRPTAGMVFAVAWISGDAA